MNQYVAAALAAGKQPRKTASDSWILRSATTGYRVLVDSGGSITPHGREYESQAGARLQISNFDRTQAAVRENNVETISMGRGGRRVVRRFDPAANKWKYTALGRSYFADRRISYVVRVPAKFSGTRSNGNAYTRTGMFPLSEPVRLPIHLTEIQRDQRIRAAVNALQGPDRILAEYAQKEIQLHRNRPWEITEIVTDPGAAGADPTT